MNIRKLFLPGFVALMAAVCFFIWAVPTLLQKQRAAEYAEWHRHPTQPAPQWMKDPNYAPPGLHEYKDLNQINIPQAGTLEALKNNENASGLTAMKERRYLDGLHSFESGIRAIQEACRHDPERAEQQTLFGTLSMNATTALAEATFQMEVSR